MANVPNGKCHRNIAENYNRLSMVHERYRQTDDRGRTVRRTGDSRSLKSKTSAVGTRPNVVVAHSYAVGAIW